LVQMRAMADASAHPMTVEMYVGWLNAGQMKIIAGLVDRMLVHAYVTNPTTSYAYALTRLQNYATINGMENVTIIFSAEPNFMGPWLNANSLQSAEQTFLNAYNAASGTWKSHVNLQGFIYFTSSMMTAAPLQSTYLAYDPMNNSANVPLTNSTGGTGWAAPWDVQSAPTTGYVFNSNPLAYSNLQNFGGSADGGQVYLTAGRALNVQDGGPFDAYVTGSNLIGSTTGTTLYSSALLQKKANNGQPVFLTLHNNNISWCDGCTTNKVAFGYFGSASDVSGQRRWSLRIGTTVYPTSIPVTIGQSAFFVLKTTFNSGNTVFDLYVNPTSLGTAGLPASPTLSQTTSTLIRMRSCAVYLGDVAGNGAVDEIRFASSYTVAAPDNSVALNLPPAGSFTMSAATGTAPLTVNFDASASIDPEGEPLTYTWNFADGTPSVSGSAIITHTFANGLTGQFPITLTVKDNVGQQHSPNKILTLYTPGTTTFPCLSSITNLPEASCGQNNGRVSINGNNATFIFKNNLGVSQMPTNTNQFNNLAAGNYSVTVTGSNGCIDTFNLKMTTDSTTCSGWQPNKCNLAMGVNVGGMADWSWEHAFINRAKHLRADLVTFHTGGTWDTNVGAELAVDADGYPTSIPQATSANAQTKVRFILSSDNGNLKANEQYVFLYDGIGSFTVNSVTVNSNTPGRVLFTVPSTSGNIWIDVSISQSGNYIRNFRLVKADEESLNPNIALFNQTFLSRLSPFKALRFMDWGHTNGSPHVSWANRAKPTMRTYGTVRGVPYEMMIALGNQTQKDIWVCVPHLADSNYIAEMAKLFRDNLDPKLTIYLEYSNEVWNWIFSQAIYNNENRPANLSYGRAYAEKAKNAFRIWTSVFAGQTNRIKRTLGLQGGYNSLNQEMMSQLSQNEWDVASPSYYFGLNHGTTGNPVLSASSTGNDVNLNARNAYFGTNGWLTTLKQDYRNIKIFGKEIVSYEGGQHYTDFNTHPYQQAMYDAQYLPSMYSLYDNVLDTIRSMGNKLAMAFTLSGVQESVYGSWGHLPNMYQNPPYMATAPKYQA
ncbi:MAG: PKD domain-containing protein, partial [Bacteroidia bacterium]